jgi:hypothetical protein
MAIAKDAVSRVGNGTSGSGGGDASWTHTPVGTPRGVLVWVLYSNTLSHADFVTGVTYGGVSMTEVAGSPNVKTVTESMSAHCFFLGSSIPTGAQTVAVDVTDTNNYAAFALTVTAAADTEVVDSDGTINSDSIADPSVTLSLGGRSCFAAIGFSSGQNAVTGITPLTGWTGDLEDDLGGQTMGLYTYNTVGTTDVTAGWTQTAEDAVAMAVAIAEVSGGPSTSVAVFRHMRRLMERR